MRVQPHFPSRPLTATVIDSEGSALWACSAANRPAPPEPRIRMSVEICFIARRSRLLHAKFRKRGRAALLGVALHLRVQAAAMAVHGDDQRPEALDAEFPQ